MSGPLAALRAAIKTELRLDGATQADLARYLGISEKHVSQVLRGKAGSGGKAIHDMAAAVGLRAATVVLGTLAEEDDG